MTNAIKISIKRYITIYVFKSNYIGLHGMAVWLWFPLEQFVNKSSTSTNLASKRRVYMSLQYEGAPKAPLLSAHQMVVSGA